jgi:hypothetical protein
LEFYLVTRSLKVICINFILEVKMSLYGDEDVIIKEKESQVAGWSQVSTVHCLILMIIFELRIQGRACVQSG